MPLQGIATPGRICGILSGRCRFSARYRLERCCLATSSAYCPGAVEVRNSKEVQLLLIRYAGMPVPWTRVPAFGTFVPFRVRLDSFAARAR